MILVMYLAIIKTSVLLTISLIIILLLLAVRLYLFSEENIEFMKIAIRRGLRRVYEEH